MVIVQIAVVLALVTVFAASSVRGAEHDFRVVDGILVEPVTLPADDVAIIAGNDDGAAYYIDLRLLPRTPIRIEARTPVSVIGYEGQRPNQIAAHAIELRQTAPAQAPVEPRASIDLRAIEGEVQSVTRESLKLRTREGQTVTVQIRALVTSWHAVVKGETLKVLGVLDAWGTLAAHAVIHYPSPAAASPSRTPPEPAR